MPLFSIFWMVPSGKILSSSPSSKMHLIVPSGNLHGTVISLRHYLHDFLGLIGEVLLDLVIAKFENLQLVRKSRLRRLGLCKEVDNLSIRKSLLDILVVEVNDSIAVWERLPFNTVVENDLFFSVLVNSLYLSIMAHILLNHFLVRQ